VQRVEPLNAQCVGEDFTALFTHFAKFPPVLRQDPGGIGEAFPGKPQMMPQYSRPVRDPCR
jgi:hypothetical protein